MQLQIQGWLGLYWLRFHNTKHNIGYLSFPATFQNDFQTRKGEATWRHETTSALQCRSYILPMYKCLSWLMVEHRLLDGLTLFFRCIDVSNKPNRLYKWIHCTSNRHNYSTRQVVLDRFTLPMPKSNAMKKKVTYRAMSTWNSLPHKIIEIKDGIHFNRQLKSNS